jgi:hypothetical protein
MVADVGNIATYATAQKGGWAGGKNLFSKYRVYGSVIEEERYRELVSERGVDAVSAKSKLAHGRECLQVHSLKLFAWFQDVLHLVAETESGLFGGRPERRSEK